MRLEGSVKNCLAGCRALPMPMSSSPEVFHIDSPSPTIFDQPISRLTALNMRFFASSINILLQDASFLIGSLDQISYAVSLSDPIIHKDTHICLRSKSLSSPILLLIVFIKFRTSLSASHP